MSTQMRACLCIINGYGVIVAIAVLHVETSLHRTIINGYGVIAAIAVLHVETSLHPTCAELRLSGTGFVSGALCRPYDGNVSMVEFSSVQCYNVLAVIAKLLSNLFLSVSSIVHLIVR